MRDNESGSTPGTRCELTFACSTPGARALARDSPGKRNHPEQTTRAHRPQNSRMRPAPAYRGRPVGRSRLLSNNGP
jgi:hypothetical protein